MLCIRELFVILKNKFIFIFIKTIFGTIVNIDNFKWPY